MSVMLEGCIRSLCSYFPLSYMVIFFFKGVFWIKASQNGDYCIKLNMKIFQLKSGRPSSRSEGGGGPREMNKFEQVPV